MGKVDCKKVMSITSHSEESRGLYFLEVLRVKDRGKGIDQWKLGYEQWMKGVGKVD